MQGPHAFGLLLAFDQPAQGILHPRGNRVPGFRIDARHRIPGGRGARVIVAPHSRKQRIGFLPQSTLAPGQRFDRRLGEWALIP
jgi:hypothetical protein